MVCWITVSKRLGITAQSAFTLEALTLFRGCECVVAFLCAQPTGTRTQSGVAT